MIHLNQTGYCEDMPKKAIITGKGECCFIVSSDNDIVFEPRMTEPFFDEASGDTVRVVDFSDIKKTGVYFLFADGLSKRFLISRRPYRSLSSALLKGMYYQRCGCALEEKHAGVYHRSICHTGKAALEHDNSVVIDVTGGWHDAGDYGRYVVPAAVTVSHMLYAYELFPKAFEDQLNIPESGNGVPDILNECRYEIEWMMKMQRREDGALYHKAATRFFAPFVMPEDDREDLLLFRVTHTSTAAFAASLAQAYRVYKPFDKMFSDRMLAASVRAWEWLEKNPVFEPFVNPPNTSSGPYGDDNCDDEIFWASCELFCATNEDRYRNSMCLLADKVDVSKLGWRDVGGLGALCCLFALKNPEKVFFDNISGRFLSAADKSLEKHQKSGYGTALDADKYMWGSTMIILNNAIILICAKLLTGEEKYQNAAQAQFDYLLGMNATGYSFVTGFGENAFRFPHHRPSYADGVDDPVPGLVSGGPNKKFPDPVCRKLLPPETPPAKSYIDHTWTASANENAIYWNSPAIFTAAYFDSLSVK
ncbi:MAG: glycoside hydrolase family 9 protein [Treponema sp.]|nr:glycoside hydrolase family 9 protein [Treponema sp.]MCL2272132.1 glycoside hydrolase family 9 protein [Treponema sp.]